jgi:hypothetical protein
MIGWTLLNLIFFQDIVKWLKAVTDW